MSDFRILERIQKEDDIEKVKSLFTKTVHNYEVELTKIHESNQVQIGLLTQQLSDSNASANALKLQIHKLKEMQEKELDQIRVNETELQSLIKKMNEENKFLKLKLQEFESSSSASLIESNSKDNQITLLQKQNQRMQIHYKNVLDQLSSFRTYLDQLRNEKFEIENEISNFKAQTVEYVDRLKAVSKKAVSSSTRAIEKRDKLVRGLGLIKKQIHEIKRFKCRSIDFDFNAFKQGCQHRIDSILRVKKKLQGEELNMTYMKKVNDLAIKLDDQKSLITTCKAVAIGTGSAFRLYQNSFRSDLRFVRDMCLKSIIQCDNRVRQARLKERKKVKEVGLELSVAKNEISLLQRSNQIKREKLKETKTQLKARAQTQRAISMKKNTKSTLYKTQVSMISGEASPISSRFSSISRVSVGTLAHLTTPNIDHIRERSRRISKEAEISSLEAELKRKNERITHLEGQIGGLRKIIRRTGEVAEEDSGKARQTITDLEAELRDEKKQSQKRLTQITKLQKDYETLQVQACKVEPLFSAFTKVFKMAAEKISPLIQEESIQEDLSELDAITKEFFNVPLHKICAPTYSRNYLKKQEHRFNLALQNNIEVEEIVRVFDSLLEELKKLSSQSKLY